MDAEYAQLVISALKVLKNLSRILAQEVIIALFKPDYPLSVTKELITIDSLA